MNEKTKKAYRRYADRTAARSPVVTDCLKAFLSGGIICTLAEAFSKLYAMIPSSDVALAPTLTSLTLIFLACLLTGLGIFDKLAKHAGAGTLVPITGFANAVSSSAIDARSEGYIFGVGIKIFAVAGPVILYGTAAGAIWGVLYYILTRIPL